MYKNWWWGTGVFGCQPRHWPKKKRRLLCKKLLKPTAKNRVSVTGKSTIHAPFTKSIVFGESIRLRRLCEHGCDYPEAIKALKYIYLKSCFCNALVDDMVKITAERKDRFGPPMKSAREVNENIKSFLNF